MNLTSLHALAALVLPAPTLTAALVLSTASAFALEEPAPIPLAHDQPEARVKLGNRLFHDPRLSADNTLSCAGCHSLRLGGVDRRALATGIGNARGNRNSPTVYNSGLLSRLFWDGRASSLEEQIDGPVHNPVEMGSSWPEILPKLLADAHYVEGFAREYPGEGVTERTVKDAIATFERSLITPHARFDRWLGGDATALSADERAGWRRFRELGCLSCHDGPLLGGQRFAGALRVPPLRNVEVTPPYFHDGRERELPGAVARMIEVTAAPGAARPEDGALIAAFLRTLTGEYKGRPLNDWSRPRPAARGPLSSRPREAKIGK